ncbi:MAG: DUF3168 domain-containing protein [Ktedonobacterales bacterium]|nr:DUF3168 domain-containing protein [Ktedonobacterales bacterium]
MGSETTVAFTWLYSVLSGDATLAGYAPGGVWRGEAPDGTTAPWVVFDQQSNVDVNNATGYRAMTNGLYQVRVVGPQSAQAAIAAAAARVDALLVPGGAPTRNASVSGGGVILACFRDSQLATTEVVSGSAGDTIWRNLGGIYRIQI